MFLKNNGTSNQMQCIKCIDYTNVVGRLMISRLRSLNNRIVLYRCFYNKTFLYLSYTSCQHQAHNTSCLYTLRIIGFPLPFLTLCFDDVASFFTIIRTFMLQVIRSMLNLHFLKGQRLCR